MIQYIEYVLAGLFPEKLEKAVVTIVLNKFIFIIRIIQQAYYKVLTAECNVWLKSTGYRMECNFLRAVEVESGEAAVGEGFN